MTGRELLLFGREALKCAGLPDWEGDAALLFRAAGQMDLSGYLLQLPEAISPETEARFREWIGRRAKREPVQYITGEAWFYGRSFRVTPEVLIPRYDTEILAEEALSALKPGMKLLDLCCGSGCILITLLLEGPEGLSGTGSDLSEKALAVAEENASRLGARASWVQADLFCGIGGPFDCIVTNPPYISGAEMQALDREVRGFEPETALYGGTDGLSFYRRITREAPAHLAEGGMLLAEIGAEQGEAVRELFAENGFSGIRVIRDLAGRDRVVTGIRPQDGRI